MTQALKDTLFLHQIGLPKAFIRVHSFSHSVPSSISSKFHQHQANIHSANFQVPQTFCLSLPFPFLSHSTKQFSLTDASINVRALVSLSGEEMSETPDLIQSSLIYSASVVWLSPLVTAMATLQTPTDAAAAYGDTSQNHGNFTEPWQLRGQQGQPWNCT